MLWPSLTIQTTKVQAGSLGRLNEIHGYTVFWERRAPLFVEFMPHAATINADMYCETLKKLWWAIQTCQRGLFSSSSLLLHDNAWLHSGEKTKQLLPQLKLEVFNYLAYRPDLAQIDYQVFSKLKEFLRGKHFESGEDLKKTVIAYLLIVMTWE